MAERNKSSLLSSMFRKTLAYIKVATVGNIEKKLFIDIRDTFPDEYRSACKFYNTANVHDIIEYTKDIIDNEVRNIITNNPDISKDVLNNQYKSIIKTLNESYDNINMTTIMNIISNMNDEDKIKNKDNLRLIIKGLILLQLINNMNDIINTTNSNNGAYNFIMEHKNNLIEKVQEHIVEYEQSLEHKFKITDQDILNETLLSILSEDSEYDFNDIDNNEASSSFNVAKFYEENLLKDSDDLIYGDDDDDDGSYDDKFDQVMQSNEDVSYSADKLDNFIYQLFLKEIMLLKIVNSNIDDSNYTLIPNKSYITYILIALILMIVSKF